ncbi:MAG: fatty acid desaturase [Cyanobacteriota bacterium]|nr:fatty acid desaturase [Cyanobacteriota bacterium]
MALLWAALPQLLQQGGWVQGFVLPVLALLVLFSARSFSLMHDCGHGSLFATPWLNRALGFVFGVINAIPQYPWSRGHAFHHKHNGNWSLYRGPSSLLTVERFLQLSVAQQRFYSVSRHPLMLFPGGFFYLIIRPRLQLLLGTLEWLGACLQLLSREGWRGVLRLRSFTLAFQSSHWYTRGELLDLIANSALVLTSWWLMASWLGLGVFWACYATVMTFSAAIFICIFFVQHNFPDSYANGTEGWSYFKGAIDGSSNLLMPSVLNWFSADIAFHSIHHLCERIPNYRLRACHTKHSHLLANSKYLRLSDIPRCFDLILWDSQSCRLVSTSEALQATPV